jgi:hypothetical protein
MNARLSGLEPGLAFYGRFDEGAGTVAADSSGHAGTATLVNGTSWLLSTAPFGFTAPAFNAFHPTASGFTFSFGTFSGSVYQPKYSTNLNDWLPLGSPIAGTGFEESVTDSAAGPRRFYRVDRTP